MNKKILNDATGTEIVASIEMLLDAGLEMTEAIEVLKLIELRAISGSLEAISEELADMAEMLESIESIDEKLSRCISHDGNNSFLCITGNVSTY